MDHAIGIDFGGTTIKSGLVCGGEILRRGRVIETQQCGGPEGIVDALVAVVKELQEGSTVRALGVGLPGMVDSVGGIVHELTNVAGWHDVALRALLSERTGLPTAIENDANAMAYAEWKFGAAKDGQHVVCITLGTGVGGALILDGRIYRGARFGAGEIGHMSIDYQGVPGHYGNFGALEKYVGNQQIADRALELYRSARVARSAAECSPAELARAANDGDEIALGLWTAVGNEIGSALASVVWLINPDTIVIGGGVAKAGDLVFGPVRKTIDEQTSLLFHNQLRIVAATLGNDAGIIGNAALALDPTTVLGA